MMAVHVLYASWDAVCGTLHTLIKMYDMVERSQGNPTQPARHMSFVHVAQNKHMT